MYFGYFGFDVFIFLMGWYMLGGDIGVFVFMFYLCFLFHIWYIDFDLYYEVIHGICLLFYVLWNQEVY